MNACRSRLKFGQAATAFSVVFLIFATDSLASAQQSQQQQSQSQSQTQQQNPPATNSGTPAEPPANPDAVPKKKKVWNNDDVVSLRTPADSYQLEKEQKEGEAASAAKASTKRNAAKSEKHAALDIKLPDTITDTESMIKDTEDDISAGAVILEKMRKEMENTPVAQQGEKQARIDRLSASIETSRRNRQALQDHLEVLKHRLPPENPPAPPSLF